MVGVVKLLPLFFALLLVFSAGCVARQPHNETKYVDPSEPLNYIVFKESNIEPGTGTFSLITLDYYAGGAYVSTGEAYSLRYAEYDVGVTLKKVENGVEIEPGIIWKLDNATA